MKKFQKTAFTGLVASVSAVALLAGAPAYAQDADEEVSVDDQDADEDDDGALVVTGSRFRNDTYTSTSPLQVLTTEAERDVGSFDAAEILQRSEFAAGQQIDATFQGFVLNNGPGSQTLNLRGLGADRTLLMINGRRMAPAGVEGAPTNPSINLLPTSLIQRYDLLLDGASSVYGSDAVAGVGNIILRNDLDGFEVFLSGNYNEQGGGDDYTISAAWGTQFNNGFIGIGAEYARRDEVLNGDRDFLSGCDTHYEISDTGQIFTNDAASNAYALQDSGGTVGTSVQPCKLERITGRVQVAGTFAGSLYYDTQDYYGLGFGGNYFIPGLSETTDAFGLPVDADGDGIQDIDLATRTRNGQDQDVSFISPQDLYNVMAYGEYTFEGDMNITPFFEALYSRAEVNVRNGGVPQFFPWVPATNAFSPCNFLAGGVDCAAAENTYLGAPFNPNVGFLLPVRPIPSITGDRNNVATVQEQYRGVLGVRGDLPFIDDSWGFEISGVYSRSEGSSVRNGIREDRLALSLGIDPTADFNGDGIVDNNGNGVADDYISLTSSPMLADGPCGSAFANPNLAPADLAAGCVPVNLFANSLYLPGPIGDFATQAERDYLFGQRTFDTTYEQITINAFVTGDVFELPAGPLSIVLGGEYREDTIDSQPDIVASDGLFWGFFADQGAQGSKYIVEGFGELNIPVFEDDFWGTFDVNASGRITREEFYGWAETYSIKGGWQPIPQLLIRASYGTSFRAPNLRENFLAGQSGFGGITDPCAVPDAAYISPALGGAGYIASEDRRDAFILENCRREGRDPTSVGIDSAGLNVIRVQSSEITSGGSLDLQPETSTSFTAGFGLEESFGALDVSFSFNYYNINVEGAIVEPTGQSVVNGCFLRDDPGRSNLCDFIGYDADPLGRRLVNSVFAGFINVNEEVVKGIDLNAQFGYDVPMGGDVLGLNLDLRANHLIDRTTTFLDDAGVPTVDEDAGEFGFPFWTGRATFGVSYSDFQFTWSTRWIGETQQQSDGIDPFSDAWGYDRQGNFTGFFSDTCLGMGSRNGAGQLDGIVAGDGNYCADVGFAEDYFVHTVSVRYTYDDWITLRLGVTNLTDTAPPRIDTNEVFGISNTAIGNGYDLNGREFFGSLSVAF